MIAGNVPTSKEPETLAELLHELGDIPPERIRWRPLLGTATAGDVERLLEVADKRICELVDGVLVEKPRGTWEALLAVELIYHLGAFVRQRKLGKVLGADGLVRLQPALIRAPDVAFVSRERLRGHKPFKESIAPLIPDLAIEILSPSNTRGEMKRKRQEYFAAGVRLVWIINPRKQTAEVYTGPGRGQLISKDQVLDGGAVLPGYQLSLQELFVGLEE